jgi:hypothetical protein
MMGYSLEICYIASFNSIQNLNNHLHSWFYEMLYNICYWKSSLHKLIKMNEWNLLTGSTQTFQTVTQ